MEKKIEEMAQDIAQAIDDVHAGCRLTDCEDCRYFKYDLENCKAYAIAERLDALDYQKQERTSYHRAKKGKLKTEQGEWISVEERLPEMCLDNEDIPIDFIVWGEGYTQATAANFDGTFFYFTCNDGSYGLMTNITHWMPLPQPPQMKGE